MQGRWGNNAAAEQLDSCLSGDAVPSDPAVRQMVMAAAALTPRRPISEAARERALDRMMREADRVASPLPVSDAEDLDDPGLHVRVAQAGPGLRLSVVDIEEVDDAAMEEIAERVAALLGQRSPDRNP
ncbi:hypothetical protein ABT024_05295 [Streptomyces sp. NPDC002812]|uniref:hypothetical protein n=1 Tax=Streptomyces sp. NPDC002812 TaxID=3154434 RepID=UPI00332488F4